VKFKQYLTLISDPDGFIPTTRLWLVIHKNPRKTAREEAIAAEVIQQANPRENITGRYPWGPEETVILQQLWFHPDREQSEWRDVPVKDADKLYSVEQTECGDLPVPNALKEPGIVRADFPQRLKDITGNNYP